MEQGGGPSTPDAFQPLSVRWKGPEWIRRQFSRRGYQAHLLYRELRETILREFGQPVDFIDDGDKSAKTYVLGQGVPYDTHAGSRYVSEHQSNPAIRERLEEMWTALTAEKETEFAQRGLKTTGWTGLQGAVMPILEPLLDKVGFTRTRLKLNSQHAAIRMIKPLGGRFALYCSATLTWTHTCDVALPTDLYLATTAGDASYKWMPMWLLRDLEAYRLFGGHQYDAAAGGTRLHTSAKSAVVGVHAFADWASLLADSFAEQAG